MSDTQGTRASARVTWGPQLIDRVLAVLPTTRDEAISASEILRRIPDTNYRDLQEVLVRAVRHGVIRRDRGEKMNRLGRRHVCFVFWRDPEVGVRAEG